MSAQLPLPGFGGNPLGWAAVAEKVGEQTALSAAIAAFVGLPIAVDLLKNPAEGLAHHPGAMLQTVENVIGTAEKSIGAPLFQALVSSALGFNLSDQSGQAAEAVSIVERAIGFSAALPLVTGGIAGILEPHFKQAMPRDMLRALRELGNDLGLNFFLGTVLAEIFESSAATPIREAVSRQKRPSRLEYREIRALLKAHALTDEQANDLLANAGYRDEDITRLKQLDRVFLNTGELSNEFMHGRISDADLFNYMDMLGYDGVDTDRLQQQWLEQAESMGAQAFRAVMRSGVLDGHISLDQYQIALTQLHVPVESISLDMAAVNLQLQWGRIKLSVSQIKQFFQKGEYSDTQAVKELVSDGYDEATANALVLDWSNEKKQTKAGIGIARILSYELSGVLTKPQALQMLIDSGLSVQLASLLSTNPSQYGGLIRHELTAQTLIGAYMDDIIDEAQLRAKMLEIGTDPVEADYQIRIAIAKKTRANKPRQTVKHLSEAQVIDAFKYGLATAGWGIRELETIGYSEADAQLIVATETTKLAQEIPAGWTPLR